jgi:hypothetical protein
MCTALLIMFCELHIYIKYEMYRNNSDQHIHEIYVNMYDKNVLFYTQHSTANDNSVKISFIINNPTYM